MFFEWFHRQVVWCLVVRVFLLSVSPFGFLSLLFLGYLQGGSNGVLSCVKLHEAGVRLQVHGGGIDFVDTLGRSSRRH